MSCSAGRGTHVGEPSPATAGSDSPSPCVCEERGQALPGAYRSWFEGFPPGNVGSKLADGVLTAAVGRKDEVIPLFFSQPRTRSDSPRVTVSGKTGI